MILESTPEKEGFVIEAYWNTRIIQHVLEEKWGISMTRFGITKMLHRWGFSYTRLTYTLKRANHHKQQAFQEHIHELKKASEDMVLIYEDESHIRDYQALHATWSQKGKQKQIPTYGYHGAVSLFGALDAMKGKFLCMEAFVCNAQSFQYF